MNTSDEKNYEPLLDIENVLSILSQISIFGGLSEKESHFLLRNLKKVRYARGESVFRQGDKAQYIYIIKSGRVKLYIGEEQDALELYEFDVGKCFGETSLIGIQPHSANVVALEDTELIVLSGTWLYELYKKNSVLFSKIILNIARETSRRLIQADNILLHYVLHDEKHETGPL